MEDIIDGDYAPAKRVCEDFEIKNLGWWLVCSKQYIIVSWYMHQYIWTWSCKNSFSLWISMSGSIKKTKVKLDLLTDIDMLLLVLKGVRGGIYYSIYRYGKANNK